LAHLADKFGEAAERADDGAFECVGKLGLGMYWG
jgi:hypothetical protein